MADNTEQKILLTVQVLDNFVNAKKNVDQWTKALNEAQVAATSSTQAITQIAAQLAAANEKYAAAQAAVQALANTDELLTASTLKAADSLATMSEALDELRQKPLDNITPEQLNTIEANVAQLTGTITEYGTNIDQANSKEFLPKLATQAKDTATSVQNVAQALTVVSGNNESFQKLADGAGDLITVIDGVSSAMELLSVKKYKAIATNVAELYSEANLRAAKLLGINTTAAQAAAEQAMTVIKGEASLASKAAAAAQWLWNTAIKANPIGALIAVIITVVSLMVLYASRINQVTEAQKAMATVDEKSNERYDEQVAKIQTLLTVLRDEHIALSKRQKALIDLQNIIPNYHASLTKEGKLINDNKNAIENYLTALEKETRFKAVQEELEQQFREKRKADAAYASAYKSVKHYEESFKKAEGEDITYSAFNFDAAEKRANKTKAHLDQVNEAIKKLKQEMSITGVFDVSTTTDTGNGKSESKNTDTDKKKKKEKEKEARKKEYEDDLKLAAEHEKNISDLSKDGLSDESVYKQRLTDFKAEIDKEKEAYDQLQKAHVISKKEAEDGKKAADDKYTQYYNKLSQDRLTVFSKDLTDKATMEKLKQQESLAGVEQTQEEKHKLEIDNAESEKNLQLQLLEEEKKLFPDRAKEIEEKIALIKQQYLTNEAKMDADNDKTVADKKLSDQEKLNELLLGNEKIYTKKQLALKLAQLEEQRLKELESIEYSDKNVALSRAINAKYDKQGLDAKIDYFNNYVDQVTSAATALSGLMKSLGDVEVQKAEDDNNTKKTALQKQLDSGLITKKKYDKEVAKSEAELAAKKKKIAKEQAIFDRSISIANTIINTAEAIVRFLKDPGGVGGVVLSAAAGITGAAQIATILATPIPTAAKGMLVKKLSSGGLLHGPSHAGGGIPIEAEGGEAIINKRSTAMFSPILSAINEVGGGVKFAAGGMVGKYASGGTVNYAFSNDGGYSARAQEKTLTADDIHKAMLSAVSQVKVYTTVEDYRKADKNYTNIESSGSV